MKATPAHKTWDEVFPHQQPLDSSVVMLNNTLRTSARHCRSQSAPDYEISSTNWDISPGAFQHFKEGWRRVKRRNKKQFPQKDLQGSLKHDVAQLEMKLQDQVALRVTLEQALGQISTSIAPVHENHIPEQTKDLVKEITMLEMEVTHLEKHLLSLYKMVFEQHFPVLSPTSNRLENYEPAPVEKGALQLVSGLGTTQREIGHSVQCQRSQSSLSQDSSTEQIKSHSSLEESPRAGLACSCHSHPLSLAQESSVGEANVARLVDHLSASIAESVFDTPNRISEDLVRCMAAIYCNLADYPPPRKGHSVSPTSSLSSTSTFSPRDRSEFCSPQSKTTGENDVRLKDPFQVKGSRESIGPYGQMVEATWICVDNHGLSYAARMLRNFRSLVRKLEKVDPRKMKYEEKLAFWVNVYNALMMHAYLAYGIPRNQLTRVSLLLKAAYKIGDFSVNAHTIEHAILGCRLHRPAQWLQTLLLPGIKGKTGHGHQAYALEHREPRVCFALCYGGRSAPAVRVYTAKNIYQELEIAKEEFLQASVGLRKGNKVILPKVLENFARESSLSSSGLLDMISQSLPENQHNSIEKSSCTRPHKSIEWLPYNYSFRYILSRDLAKWSPPLVQ